MSLRESTLGSSAAATKVGAVQTVILEMKSEKRRGTDRDHKPVARVDRGRPLAARDIGVSTIATAKSGRAELVTACPSRQAVQGASELLPVICGALPDSKGAVAHVCADWASVVITRTMATTPTIDHRTTCFSLKSTVVAVRCKNRAPNVCF